MKKLLTIAVFGRENVYDNSMLEEVEIISAEGENALARLKKSKGLYVTFLLDGFKYGDVRQLFQKLTKDGADIITFAGGQCFKASALKPNEFGGDIFNCVLSAVLGAKSVEKTALAPFKLAESEMDCSDGAFGKLDRALKEYSAAKNRVPVEVYSYARDVICDKIVPFYRCYTLAVRMGADNKKLAEFDKRFKDCDLVLYKVFENRFGHAELEKLRLKNFKISFITANRYKKMLGVK